MKEDRDSFASVFSPRTNTGISVTAQEVCQHWCKPMKLSEDFVTLVGGACNFEEGTQGDIDVLLRKDEPGGEEDVALLFRLWRALPKDLQDRIHFVYDRYHGPFTSHLHVYDLWLVPSGKTIDLMSEDLAPIEDVAREAEAKKSRREGIVPGRFFRMLKPMHGRRKGEEYSIESLIEVVKSRKDDWLEQGIFVEPKYDGVHVQIHRWDDEALIFTEEGTDVSSKLPTLRQAVLKEAGDFVWCGELELWKEGAHEPRQLTAAVIHTKEVHPDEAFVIANLFDEVYSDKDTHEDRFEDRRKRLRARKVGVPLKIGSSVKVTTEEKLRKEIGKVVEIPGSEGAYLKLAGFPYELDGKSILNIKFKSTAQLDVEVFSVHKVADAEAYNYLCIVGGRGGTRVPVGNTYNTSIKASPGDILTVEFVEINRYTDPKTEQVWYNFWAPRVLRKREDKKTPDSVATVEKLVKSTGGTDTEKAWPSRYGTLGDEVDANLYLFLPDEAKKWKGMCHAHIRGKSIHLDLRFQINEEQAVGWTLYVPKGLSKAPETIEEAKSLYGAEIEPLVKKTLSDPLKKFNCGTKKPEPIEWLTFKGRKEPGEVGATKNEPGYLLIIDSFEVQFGAQKSYYHEYFCDGKLFNGRVLTRLLENKEEWKKTDEGVMTWMCWIAKEETPYTISPRAVKKSWIPPEGHSALPRGTRAEVPETLEYWKKEKESERKKLRDEIVEGKRVDGQDDADISTSFKLQKQTWKGPHVIRWGPSREEYHLLVEDRWDWVHPDDLRKNPETTVFQAPFSKERWDAEGEVEPGTRLNPSKNTPSNIQVIDEGQIAIEEKDGSRIIKLTGKELAGTWTMTPQEGAKMWSLKQQ